ncbi:MAG TPA: sigma-70 family RNA polymerase sigma factor [bacterium]
MSKENSDRHCPLKLLSQYEGDILSNLPTLSGLDDAVRQYLAVGEEERAHLRATLFFKLSPFLLKSLSWYCHISGGCGVNCKVADLLSTSYLVFTDLIEQFDFDRHLNFLGYIVNGLSWGLFNSYVKERRYSRQRIFLSEGEQDLIAPGADRKENEEHWLSAIELEELLSMLKPATRDLFVLHFLFGYSLRDLATLHQTKVKTVQKIIERARKKIVLEFSKKMAMSI